MGKIVGLLAFIGFVVLLVNYGAQAIAFFEAIKNLF